VSPQISEKLDPQPFRDWVNQRLHRSEGKGLGERAGTVSAESLAQDLGIDHRRLYAWRFETQYLERIRIEEALHHAGFAIWEVYEPDEEIELEEEAHCDQCGEIVTPIKGDCPWCGSLTKKRATRKRRGGWKRPDLAGSRYTEAQLRAMHIFHMRDGISINELGRRTFEIAGYKSNHSAAVAISRQWKRLGLSVRDRIEQTVISSTKHGRKRRKQTRAEQNAYRRWLAQQRGWRSIQGPW
jgi:hypothetical protein